MKTNRYHPIPALTMAIHKLAAGKPMRRADVERAAPCARPKTVAHDTRRAPNGIQCHPLLRAAYARGGDPDASILVALVVSRSQWVAEFKKGDIVIDEKRARMAAHLLHNEAHYILGMGDKFRIGIVAGHVKYILEGSDPVGEYREALAWQGVALPDRVAAVASVERGEWPETSLVGRVEKMRSDAEDSVNGHEEGTDAYHEAKGVEETACLVLDLLGVAARRAGPEGRPGP